jgi:poly(beta-D-mannuronate) lyase
MLSLRRRRLLLGMAAVAAVPAVPPRAWAAEGGWGPLPLPSGEGARVPPPRRTVEVDDGDGLAAALERARPGDHIVLADGEYAYGQGFTVAGDGPPGEASVVIRAARPGGAVLRSPVLVEADGACLVGLDFAAPDAVTLHGDRNAILRCRFRELTGVLLRRGASHNSIGWNSFRDLPYVRGEGKNAIRLDPRPRDRRPMSGNHIYRNYFSTDFEERQAGGSVCVYVGLSKQLTKGMPPTATLIEHNLFDRIDYKSAVRIKTHGCVVRYNTAIGPGRRSGRRNMSQFAQRQGEGCRWHGNWAEATVGYRINAYGQELLGNVATKGASIDLNCGSERNKTACSYSLFVANEGPCVVGNREFNEPVAELCESNWFEAHKPGPDAIKLSEWQVDTRVSPDTARRGLPRAVRLGPDDVGADAPGAPAMG